MMLIRKIAALIIVMIISGWIFQEYMMRDFLDQHAEQLLQVRKIENCDVVYMSASSNFSQDGDEDRRKISQMLAAHFPNQRFEAINKPASHAGIYKRLIKTFPAISEVNTFVITINMRTFGADWIFSELEPSLNKSNLMYNNRPPLFNRILVGLQAYRSNTEEQRNELRDEYWNMTYLPVAEEINSVNKWCAAYKWGDWRNPKRQLADQFIKQYAFVIDEDNPRIQDLDDIVQQSNERGIKILFHILPENVEKAYSLVGPELVSIMQTNANFISDRYSSKGIVVVNSISELPSERFTDKDFPTEHYDESGRQTVANLIAQELKKL